ncbi:MAG TPA: NAD-dependent epimerase/dehydratase family protein [Alphaproteobacteria bacterium]|jgi:nucleoside-diphosphate-sugar epimerase|nr:NAD-dependent epimerase/dehydratase family protein [Alphaproteobacteria bacterium]
MRIFLTGASGYAGFYAALRLADAGHTVTGVVRHPEQPRLQALRMREIKLIHGDVAEPDTYRDELEECDAIVHTMLDKKRHFETDRALFGALESLSPRPRRRRFVYTTGVSIIGKVDVPLLDETIEPNPAQPISFRRKLEHEAFALKNVSTVVLRPGFIFGNDGFNSTSTDWFAMAEQGDPVFRGDQEKGWSWIHVDDLAEAYRLASEADESVVDGEIFHIVDEYRPRCLDVMRRCVAAAGYPGPIRLEAPIKGDNISMWFDQNAYSSSRKARERLGWTSRHDSVIDSVDRLFAAWKAAQVREAETVA